MERGKSESKEDQDEQVLVICTSCQMQELKRNSELLRRLIGDAKGALYSTKLENFYDAAKFASKEHITRVFTTGWINWLGGLDIELPEEIVKIAQEQYGLGNLTPIKMDFV